MTVCIILPKGALTYTKPGALWLLLLMALKLSGQGAVDPPGPDAPDESARHVPRAERYLNLPVGVAAAAVRDVGTSPLFYSGLGLAGGAAMEWQAPQWDLRTGVEVLAANLLAETPRSDYFQSGAAALLVSSEVFGQYLRRIDRWSTPKNRYDLGGSLLGTFNVRSNPSLFNNATALETFAHLNAVARWRRDISRKEDKVIHIWFMRLRLKKLEQNFSVQAQAALLNFNYRPGYAFSSLPEIDSDNPNALNWGLSDHQWSLNGWRMGTRIEYTRYTPRGNGHRLSYVWDALNAPGQYHAVQMASHRVQYTLMFHTR